MKQTEKQRLIALTQDAVAQIKGAHPKIKAHAEKAAANFSPTNHQRYRALAEIAWWLIATDANEDAMRLLNALCELNDEYYWTFHALGSAFAARAWLHAQRKEDAAQEAAQEDARTALEWIFRDPNAKAITEAEVRGALERVDGWLDSATSEKGTVMALGTLSHAMRVLVMYQQVANAGDPAAKAIPSREFTMRVDAGIGEMRRRIQSW